MTAQAPLSPPPASDLPPGYTLSDLLDARDQTSLDPIETNVQVPGGRGQSCGSDCDGHPTPSHPSRAQREQAFRHSGWRSLRIRTAEAMQRIGLGDSRRQAFEHCGEGAWILRDAQDPARIKVAASYCHDRWCLPCSKAKSLIIASNVAMHLGTRRSRFITLTLRSTTESLAGLLDRLIDSFRRLRRSALWIKSVDGGVAFLEVKWSAKAQRWHPHLHILAEGRYLRNSDLSAKWHQITGDSYITDIRMVRESDQASEYAAKYAGKPMTSTFGDLPDQLDEAMLALHGRRLVTTFGSWRGVDLTHADDDTEWIVIGPLTAILDAAQFGQAWACAIINHLRRRLPCPNDQPGRPP